MIYVMILIMECRCLYCGTLWEEPTRHHYCQKCTDYLASLDFGPPKISVIHKVSLANGETINKGHLKDIQSRVVDDEGKSIKGREGVKYMKSKGDKYAARLKDYYETKI